MGKWLNIIKDHMTYSYNLSNVVSITYNEKTKCLYIDTTSDKHIEITEISKEEFISMSKFIGSDVN